MQILTKDSVTVFVNAIMYYKVMVYCTVLLYCVLYCMYCKVKDATSAIANVDDYSGSAQLLAATTLRNVLGTRNLGDILADREAIAHEMQSGLDEATDSWGVLVERVEVGVRSLDATRGYRHQQLLPGEGCPGPREPPARHGRRGRGCA